MQYLREKFARPKLSSLSIFFSIGLGLLAVGGLLSLSGINPLKVYQSLFSYSLTSKEGFTAVYLKIVPIMLCAMTFLIGYKVGFFNIGGEGQLFIGSIFAALAGIYLKGLPAIIHIPLVLAAGFVGGALCGIILAVAKIKLGINEVLLSLLFNFVWQNFSLFLLFGPIQTETFHGLPYTDTIQPSAFLPKIYGRMHSGVFIVIAIAIVLWIVINRTSFGYKIQCVGKSFRAAKYAGINTNRMFLIVVSLSAGLAGLAGAIEVTGVYGFAFDQVTHGFGYIGTTTALLSNLRLLYLLPASFLVAFLLAAGESVKIIAGAPAETSHLLLSFVLLGTLIYLYLQEREKTKVKV